jgi:hypothetical protein
MQHIPPKYWNPVPILYVLTPQNTYNRENLEISTGRAQSASKIQVKNYLFVYAGGIYLLIGTVNTITNKGRIISEPNKRVYTAET